MHGDGGAGAESMTGVARGRFLVLEGIDGSGTTTHSARLGDHLATHGVRTLLTAEPSRGPIGKDIRRILTGDQHVGEAALALLFAADRLDHLEREIEPALAEGTVVISDRYLLSSLAYQSLDLPLSWIEAINRRARLPDMTFFLRVSPETAARRRAARGGSPERFEEAQTQERIARRYERALGSPLAGRVRVIDAEGDIDTVAETLARETEQALGLEEPAGRSPP